MSIPHANRIFTSRIDAHRKFCALLGKNHASAESEHDTITGAASRAFIAADRANARLSHFNIAQNTLQRIRQRLRLQRDAIHVNMHKMPLRNGLIADLAK